MKIIVGVDGSAPSTRALDWCARYAQALDAEVVAVFALDFPVTSASGFGFVPIPVPIEMPTEAELARLHDKIAEEWCRPLADAGAAYRVEIADGAPAAAIMAAADKEDADLVVTGRRGHGGFAELILGGTTHHLAHHLTRPLVIVP